MKALIHITRDGERWDAIAWRYYRNVAELPRLLAANPHLAARPTLPSGQRVVVRADAFPGKDFEGLVTTVAQSLGTPRIASRGPRRPNDVEVVEVMVALDGNPPLFTGMRVDAFFKLDTSASAAEVKSN